MTDEEFNAAFNAAKPEFMNDGHGLRGPQPQIGGNVRSVDGADGNFGALQVRAVRKAVEEADPVNSPPPGTLLMDVVYLDTSDDTLYFTDIYTDGRKDAV